MIQGNLDRLHLGDLLQWLHLGGLTGRLTLTERHRKRHLDLIDGEIVYASSTVPSERLASWLATEGLLPVSSLRQLLALSLLRRTPLTGLLIDRVGFSPDNLRRSLTRLAQTITSRVLNAPAVRFQLDPDYPVRQLLGLALRADPHILIMEAARHSDEHHEAGPPEDDAVLPLAGDAFESFFWQLVRSGIPDEERVDGDQLSQLHDLLRDIVGALAQWLTAGSGLVPLPPDQASRIWECSRTGDRVDLVGLPQAVWNQMVLACSIRTPHLDHPETLGDVLDQATELALWDELAASELWLRPQAGRIDALTEEAAASWARSAAAAAPHIGVGPDTARLAVHLVAVPTDLVLWVLATLPVPHRALRRALLRELPRRLGKGLAHVADFPSPFRQLFDHGPATSLGTCLHLGRRALASSQVWPDTVPDDESLLLDVAPPLTLSRAAAAAREAVEETPDSPAAAV